MKRLVSICLSLALILLCCPTALAETTGTQNGFSYTVLEDATASVTAYTGAATAVVVPDTLGGYTVTKIGVNVFAGMAITSVTLPDTVTFIDECAFESCTALASITLGSALETVGYYAFYGCTSLSDIYYGGSAARFATLTVMNGNDAFSAATVHTTEPQTETVSLLPATADGFTRVSAGGGSISVSTHEGGGYTFSSAAGWPQGITAKSPSEYVAVDVREEIYLNYHFTVKSGATNIIVFFNGQDPYQSVPGTWVSLNGLVDPFYVEPDGTVYDLGVGSYKGSVKVSDLGFDEDLLMDNVITLSDVKVFAVGGTTIVTELSVGAPQYLPEPVPDAQYLTTLLPPSPEDFTTVEMGGGEVYVSKDMDGGYWFDSWQGWPYAYTQRDESDYVWADTTKEQYLYYDFTVYWGATNVLLFFGGQDPAATVFPAGSYVSLNKLIDPNLQNADGSIIDLPMGDYRGKIPISDLECGATYMHNGRFAISDVKIFAVEGTVLVNELAVYTPPVAPDKPLGDVTGDGVLNMMDAVTMFSRLSGTSVWADAELAAADYDKSGTVDMMDCLQLYNTVAGM